MNKENENTLLLLIRGQTTHFGNIIFDYANKLLIANLTVGSSFFMMIYLSSESFIQLFLNLFTGHFADFNNRKRILILTDLMAGAVTFLLFLFYNPNNIWSFVVVNSLLAILFSFNRPTYKAIVRDLLSSDGIHRYNSISKILAEIVAVSAPIFSVFVIQEFGFRYGMLINSISFFISAICEHFFHILKVNKSNNISFLAGITNGFKYVVRDQSLLIILIASALLNFLDAIYSFYLPFTSSFSGNKNLYAYILVAQSIGSIGGALIAGIYKKTLRPGQFFHLLLPGAGALMIVGFASSSQPLVLILFGIFTSSVTLFNVNLTSYLQITVNSEFLGRVFSIIFTISGVFVPFGSFVASVMNLKNWNIFPMIGIGQLIIYILCLIVFSQIKKRST